MRTMSTPRRKISMSSKQKPLRIAILGQNGVGKSGRVKKNEYCIFLMRFFLNFVLHVNLIIIWWYVRCRNLIIEEEKVTAWGLNLLENYNSKKKKFKKRIRQTVSSLSANWFKAYVQSNVAIWPILSNRFSDVKSISFFAFGTI